MLTSGNRSDEPIAYRDEDALERLGDIADAFLTHDRPIHVRVEDSVVRPVDDQQIFVRRSRGAPLPASAYPHTPAPRSVAAPSSSTPSAWRRARLRLTPHG